MQYLVLCFRRELDSNNKKVICFWLKAIDTNGATFGKNKPLVLTEPQAKSIKFDPPQSAKGTIIELNGSDLKIISRPNQTSTSSATTTTSATVQVQAPKEPYKLKISLSSDESDVFSVLQEQVRWINSSYLIPNIRYYYLKGVLEDSFIVKYNDNHDLLVRLYNNLKKDVEGTKSIITWSGLNSLLNSLNEVPVARIYIKDYEVKI
jgi:hypothetical protein